MAAEKIVLAEFEFDLEQVEKDQKKFVKSINEISKSQRELREETENLTEATEEQTEEYLEQDRTLKGLNKQFKANEKLLLENKAGIKGLVDELDRENKSTKQAADNNKKLRAIKSNLNLTTKEGIKINDEINKKINQNTDFIKKNSDELVKNRINVGNYQDAVSNLIPGLGGLIQAFKATTIGSRIMSIAMLAIPILAILAPIVLLIKAFTDTEEGMNKIKQISAGLTAGFNALFNIVKIVALSGFAAFGKLLSGDFSGALEEVKNGIDQVAEATDGLVDKVKKAAGDASKLEELRQEFVGIRRESELTVSKLEKQRIVEEGIRDNEINSFKDREDASKKLFKINADIANKKVLIVENELKLLKESERIILASNGRLSTSEKDALNEAQIAFLEAEAERLDVLNENERERDMLRSDRLEQDLDILIDGFDNLKTIRERELKLEKTTFKRKAQIIDELNNLAQETFEKQIETLEEFNGVQIDANELIMESDTLVLRNKLTALGLGEKAVNRLFEVVRERRTVEADLAEEAIDLADKELANTLRITKEQAEAFRKEADSQRELRAINFEIKQLEEEERHRIDQQDLIDNNEALKNIQLKDLEFALEQEREFIEEDRAQRLDAINLEIDDDKEKKLQKELVQLETQKALTDLERDGEEERKKIRDDAIKLRNEKIKEGFELGTQILSSALALQAEINKGRTDAQIRRTEAKFDAEIAAAGNNAELVAKLEAQKADALQAIAEKGAEKDRKLKKKQLKLELIVAIAKGAVATITALANPPGPPFSIPQAIAAGIAAGIQIVTIKNQLKALGGSGGSSGSSGGGGSGGGGTVGGGAFSGTSSRLDTKSGSTRIVGETGGSSTSERRFAKGTSFLRGPGSGTSDSIPIWGSRGEGIVPALSNSHYAGLTQSMIDGNVGAWMLNNQQIINGETGGKAAPQAKRPIVVNKVIRSHDELMEMYFLKEKFDYQG